MSKLVIYRCDKCGVDSDGKSFDSLTIKIDHEKKSIGTFLGYDHLCRSCAKPIIDDLTAVINQYATADAKLAGNVNY